MVIVIWVENGNGVCIWVGLGVWVEVGLGLEFGLRLVVEFVIIYDT